MPWAVLIEGDGKFESGSIHRLDPVTGDPITTRKIESDHVFKRLVDGLFVKYKKRSGQPVDVYTYGAYQWPHNVRITQSIDLKYKYAEHHGKEPDTHPTDILGAIKSVIVQSRFKLVSKRGKEFYFWLPNWK